MNKIKAIALSSLLLTTVNTASADPAPGNPKVPPPVGVFCIQPTLIIDTGGGDTRIVFEMVNWTHDVSNSLDLDMQFGFNQTDPVTSVVSSGYTAANNWTGVSSTGTSANYSIGGGTAIPNIDLGPPFLNPLFPNAPDSGGNARFGFEVIVNDWGPSERLAFNWTLGMQSLGLDPDQFDSGVWVMDRNSDPYSPGNLVQTTVWEQPFPNPFNGFGQIDFISNPLDPVLTDQNAASFGVPEPSTLTLALASLAAIAWRKRQDRI